MSDVEDCHEHWARRHGNRDGWLICSFNEFYMLSPCFNDESIGGFLSLRIQAPSGLNRGGMRQ